MNFKFINIIILITLFTSQACKQSDPIEKKLVANWSDEFNGEELDNSKWEFQLGDGSEYGIWGWGNEEKQYYTKNNLEIKDGKLRIKALKEDINGYQYSSARIRSLNKGDFKYGRIEASMKMDNTNGLWHAFWMLPSNPDEGWPISGEIDIMEYVGNSDDQILNYIHMADINGVQLSRGNPTFIQLDNNFHQFAIEWDENQIVWYRDSIETYAVKRTEGVLNPTWPFDAEFHLILNVAVGGNLGGNIDEKSMESPKYMEVEYVRVYQ